MGSPDDVAAPVREPELARLRALLSAGSARDVVRALGKWPPAERTASPEALVLLAEAHLAAGATGPAIEAARGAVRAAQAGDMALCAGAALALSLAAPADSPSLGEGRATIDPLVDAVGSRCDDVAARVHHADGVIRLGEGRLDDARLALLDAVSAATACGDGRRCAVVHDALATVHVRLGDATRALGHLDESVRLRTALGDLTGRAATHRSRGEILLREGRAEAALAEFEACIELSHQVRDANGLSVNLLARGTALTEVGRFDEADAALRAALRISESAGHARQAAACTHQLAVLADRRGLRDDAIALALNAVVRFDAANDAEGSGRALTDLGRMRVRAGESSAARPQFERAIVLLRKARRHDLLADALLGLAEADPQHVVTPVLLDEAEAIAREHMHRRIVRAVHGVRERLPPVSPGARVHGARNYVTFGRDQREFHLVERFGGGAQGECWKAIDAATGRPVLVKLQPVADRTADDRVRCDGVLRDLETALRLDHRGVVRVHDFERVGRELFLATDAVTGLDLRAHLRGGPAEPGVAWSWITDLAAALDALHGAGIVHHDLRPEVVLLDPAGRPVVIDFGLALLADCRGPLATRLAGTPGYSAPDVWSGAPTDHRADLFSFGAVAIEILTGRNFITDASGARSTAELVALMKDARRLSALADAIAWPDHVGPASRASLRSLVDPDPARRPASAGAAIAACWQG